MNKRQRDKLRRDVDEAGDQKNRESTLHDAIYTLRFDSKQLAQEMENQRFLFTRRLNSWWSSDEPVRTPFLIPEDNRSSQLYRVSAYTCMSFESLLAGWIINQMDYQWWVGLTIGGVVALLTAVLLHGCFLLAFRNMGQPKQTLGRIKRLLLKPSLILFSVSFSILLLSRTVSGKLALLLEPAFGISLYTTTVGLLLLAGALLAAAHVVGWSTTDHREYVKLVEEQFETDRLRTNFESMLGLTPTETDFDHRSFAAPRGD